AALLAQAQEAITAAGVEHGDNVEDAGATDKAHGRYDIGAMAYPHLMRDATADRVGAQPLLPRDGAHGAPQLGDRAPGHVGAAAAIAGAGRGLQRQAFAQGTDAGRFHRRSPRYGSSSSETIGGTGAPAAPSSTGSRCSCQCATRSRTAWRIGAGTSAAASPYPATKAISMPLAARVGLGHVEVGRRTMRAGGPKPSSR